MTIEPWIVILGSVVAIVLTRSAYRLLNPEWRNTDAYVHFNIIREIRRNGHRPPEYHSQTLHPGKYTYPPLIHVLLSLLPERYYTTIDRAFSPIVDILFGALLIALIPAGILDVSGAAVALVLFVATPQFVRPDMPHGVGLSARKPGVILFSISVLSFLFWTTSGSTVVLAVALVAGTLLPLASRFSLQAFLVVTLTLGVFYDPLAIAYFVGSVVLAVLVSGGFYWRALVAHIRFAVDYAKKKQYKFLYDGFKSVDTIKRFLRGVRTRSPKDVLETLFDSILLRSLVDNLFIIPTVVAIILGVPAIVPPGYVVWVFAGLGAYVLTSLYHLRFLGHAGRYLEYVFVPGVVIVAASFGQRGAVFDRLVYLTIIAGIASIVAYVIVQQRWTDETERSSLKSLVEQLRSLPSGRVLVQPRNRGAEIAWRTDHVINDFLGTGFDTPETIAKRNRLYPEKEGWLTADTEWLASAFDPDWIVFDRGVSDNAPENALDEPAHEPEWQSDEYALYSFRSSVE
jgi:uncharacterized protein YggT (Ycf19 family)